MKVLTFDIKNTFTDCDVLKITMPYDPHKSMTGYYSKMWKRLKLNIATIEKVPMDKINLKATLSKQKLFVKRIIFEFGCGVILDMPSDADKFDYKVVIAQLNVLAMTRNKPQQP